MVHSYSRSFDAVYAWTFRDRVIIKRMTAYLARERQDVFVEMEEMGRRRLVAVEREKTTLVANAKQYAMMRAKQEEHQIYEREAKEAFGHDVTF